MFGGVIVNVSLFFTQVNLISNCARWFKWTSGECRYVMIPLVAHPCVTMWTIVKHVVGSCSSVVDVAPCKGRLASLSALSDPQGQVECVATQVLEFVALVLLCLRQQTRKVNLRAFHNMFLMSLPCSSCVSKLGVSILWHYKLLLFWELCVNVAKFVVLFWRHCRAPFEKSALPDPSGRGHCKAWVM